MTTVQDFRVRRRLYKLREDGRVGSAFAADMDDEGKPPVGFGDIVTMVLGVSPISVAFYVWNEELRLVINGMPFDLLQPDLRVERVAVFPFIKRFTIWRGTESLLSINYVRADALEDPHAGTKDILKFVSEIAQSRERRLRFYLVWLAIQRGQDVTSEEAREKVEIAVRQALS